MIIGFHTLPWESRWRDSFSMSACIEYGPPSGRDDDFLPPKPALTPCRRGVIHDALCAHRRASKALCEQGVMRAGHCASKASCEQGVMNHAPTGSPISIVNILHHALVAHRQPRGA